MPGQVMDEQALFTKFWTRESAVTATVLGRIPDGSDYRPDPKSRTAQEIAWQIVGEELGIDGAADLRSQRRRAVAGRRPHPAPAPPRFRRSA